VRYILKFHIAKRYFIIRLLARIAHACYFCLFPIYLYNRGYNVFDISVLETIFALCIVLFEVPTGIIADRMRRDKCIHLSYVLLLFSYVMIFVNQSYIILVIANIIMALSAAFSSGIIDVWLIDGLQNEGYAESMTNISSFMQITDNLGLTIGLLVGGGLATLTMKYAFIGGLTLIVLANILCFGLVKDENYKKNVIAHDERIAEYLLNSIKVVTLPFLCVSVSMAFVSFAIASPLNDHWQVFFNLKGIDNKFLLSNIYSIRTVLIIIGGILASKLAKREDRRNLSIFRTFIFCSAIALIISAFSPNCWMSLLFWSIISITNTIARSFWTAELISTMDPSRRSTLFSINSLIFSLASAGGSLVIGKVAELRSISYGWVICGCIMFGAVLFSFIATVQVRKKVNAK